jgi:membrane peptidoglycan carboxypeptidase
MNKVRGGTLPAEIWHDVMLGAHERKVPLALPDATTLRPPPVASVIAPPKKRTEDDEIAKMLTRAAAEASDVPNASGQTTVTPSGRVIVRPPQVQ